MKKILTALVMALTFTTGAFAQPSAEMPSFLQNTNAVSMTTSDMKNVRGQFGALEFFIATGIVAVMGAFGIWYTTSGDVINDRTSGLIP